MATKDIVKRELDHLPDDVIEQVYAFMCTIRPKHRATERTRRRVRTFKLHGRFDTLHLRELAYE